MNKNPEPIRFPIVRSSIDDLPPDVRLLVEKQLRDVAREAAERSHHTVVGEERVI